jgi:signal transduction histidine kinase
LALLPILRKPFNHSGKSESLGFFITVLAIAVFVFSEGIVYATASYDEALLPGEPLLVVIWLVRIYCIAATSAGWFLLGLGFRRRQMPSRRSLVVLGAYLGLFAIITSIDMVGVSVDLLIDRSETTFHGGLIDAVVGPVFDLHTMIGYGLVLAATGLMLLEGIQSNGLRRKQSFTLAIAAVPPVVMNAIHLFVVDTPLDLTALGFVLSVPILSWGIYRVELLDIAPVARKTVMAEMDDAVVTLDPDNRVLDCNRVARDLFDIGDDEDYFGMPAHVFFSSLPAETLERFENVDDIETEVQVPIDDEQHYFSLSISPIRTTQDAHGRVIVLRDITPIKRREQDLKAREEELDLLRQLFSRVLRHNIRNELTVVKGIGDQIVSEADAPYDRLGKLIVDSSEDLLAMSQKARHIERIVNQEAVAVSYDLRDLVERTVQEVRDEYPDATFEISGTDTWEVECSPGLDAALWNLVENAVEHGSPERGGRDAQNDGRSTAIADTDGGTHDRRAKRTDGTGPDVRIEVTQQDGQPVITISDEGPGIEHEELAVLDEAAETQLLHGSGIGLWLVKWVVDRSDATLSFDTGQDGTDVTIQFDESAVVPDTASDDASVTAAPD